MFERYSDEVRRALSRAHHEAWTLRHHYLGPEHLLLGLIGGEDDPAARVLATSGLELEATRELLIAVVGQGREASVDEIPFTERTRWLLEVALRESVKRGRDHVGTEHVLLAVLLDADGIVLRLILDQGTAPHAILAAIDPSSAEPEPMPPLPAGMCPEDLIAGSPPELGWRGRAIALCSLGAARLARSAFAARGGTAVDPLGMELLVHLTLTMQPGPPSDPGQEISSLAGGLNGDQNELDRALTRLIEQQLVFYPMGIDEDRVAITPAGVAKVEAWLTGVVPLFAGWPPEHRGVDDAVG